MQIGFPDFENITLGEWLILWYETYKKPNLTQNSLRNIEQQIRLHTPEWLKDMPLKTIKLFHIERALLSIPLGRTRKYTKQVLHSAFKKAQQLDIIEKNVVTMADEVKYKRQKSNALTIKEQKEFIEAIKGRRFEFVMLFYLYTGVRRAEALTIEWQDIDEESGLILIKGTKTENSTRYIVLTDEVKSILERQHLQNQKEKIKDNRVFPYSNQQTSRNFKIVCPNHHLHDLRHTFITRCAECGVNPNVCQQLVGHSTADMTMNVYTHVMDEFKRKEALKFTIFPKY
jgi:integrase